MINKERERVREGGRKEDRRIRKRDWQVGVGQKQQKFLLLIL